MKKFFLGFAAWVRLTRFGLIPMTPEIDAEIQRIAEGRRELNEYINVEYSPPGIYESGRGLTRVADTHCATRYNLTLHRYELVRFVDGREYVSWSVAPFSRRAAT